MRSYGKAIYIALILLLIATPAYSEAQSPGYSGNVSTASPPNLGDLDVYLGMHTINFSQILSAGVNSYSGFGSLNGSLQKILEALRNISMGCNTMSCLASNSSARTGVEQSVRELERAGYLDPRAASEILDSINQAYLSDEILRNLISDPEVSQLISSILVRGGQDYQNALGILDSLFRGGRISLNEYMAALELLKRISLRQGLGDQALMIDRMQLEIVRQLILSGTAEGLVRSLTNILGSTKTQGSTQQGVVGGDRTAYLGAIPSNIYMPTPSSISGLDFLALALILVGVSTAIILAVLDIPSMISRILRSLGSREKPGSGEVGWRSGVVGIYWRAVDLLSRRVPRRPSDTHREYLEKVRGSLVNVDPFEDLTKIYERVKYGHEAEERYVEKALRDYEELERS